MDMRKLAEDDPLIRNVEKDAGGDELSPMDPPDAFAPPATEVVPYDELHPCLKRLVDDHRRITEHLTALDATLTKLESDGLGPQTVATLAQVLARLDADLVAHHRREEWRLFPLLHARLISVGEHSASRKKRTGVDVLLGDHIDGAKRAAVAVGFIGLSTRLADEPSSRLALTSGLRQAKALGELLRLHIFREENIIFGLAQKHLTRAELDSVAADYD